MAAARNKATTGKATTKPDPTPVNPTPAEAAAGEETGAPVQMVFRDATFLIPRERIASMHFQMALAAMNYPSIMVETLDATQRFEMLSMVDRGEDPYKVAGEFIQALSKAAGWGNSSSSG